MTLLTSAPIAWTTFFVGVSRWRVLAISVAVVPAAPSLTAATPTKDGVRLTWADVKDARWWHYNVYAADRPDFVCDRSTLVASPSEAGYLDWQAPTGRKCYRVTQVTLDGLESAPSEVGEVTH